MSLTSCSGLISASSLNTSISSWSSMTSARLSIALLPSVPTGNGSATNWLSLSTADVCASWSSLKISAFSETLFIKLSNSANSLTSFSELWSQSQGSIPQVSHFSSLTKSSMVNSLTGMSLSSTSLKM